MAGRSALGKAKGELEVQLASVRQSLDGECEEKGKEAAERERLQAKIRALHPP